MTMNFIKFSIKSICYKVRCTYTPGVNRSIHFYVFLVTSVLKTNNYPSTLLQKGDRYFMYVFVIVPVFIALYFLYFDTV